MIGGDEKRAYGAGQSNAYNTKAAGHNGTRTWRSFSAGRKSRQIRPEQGQICGLPIQPESTGFLRNKFMLYCGMAMRKSEGIKQSGLYFHSSFPLRRTGGSLLETRGFVSSRRRRVFMKKRMKHILGVALAGILLCADIQWPAPKTAAA